MLENAKRQLFLVLLVALGAVYIVATWDLNLGPDLQGGTELIYEVDIEQAVRDGVFESSPSEGEIDRLMSETVAIVQERIDPDGTIEAVVLRRGDTGLLVELPAMDRTRLDSVASRVADLGRLEMRIVASSEYAKDGVKFDIATEKSRLESWLGEGNNRQMIAEDPSKIALYNSSLTNQNLKWFPQRILPDLDDPKVWDAMAGFIRNDEQVVAAFDETMFNGGLVSEKSGQLKASDGTETQRFLVAFYPVNMHEESFSGDDLEAAGVHATIDDAGKPAIAYEIKGSRKTDYADWSDKYTDQRSAIILNGYVYSAPVFRGRIPGRGIIEGRFTSKEVSQLVKVLKTGSLKVKPVETSRRTIGASLGQRAVDLGMWSIAIGGFFVLLFIVAYYRLAGLVAFAAIGLNVFLILAAIKFIEATLTLPGIAGLVLTMGMAVDANILIYERIREELDQGKELLQAIRLGFERAMVTILDANVTTFLAGLVLFNVGVGPIRGFAVTLMIGIVTSVFTAFFVSRLVFHFLLSSKLLREFHAARWFAGLKFDFMSYAKPVFSASIVVVLFGLVTFFVTPDSSKLGLDFTGGAKMQVVLSQPTSAPEFRELLRQSEFNTAFPSWSVNTVGNTTGGASDTTHYNVKVKLTAEQRAQFEADRIAATREEREYKAPYVSALERTLGELLVHKAFENASLAQDPEQPSRQFAKIELNFAKPVRTAELAEAVRLSYGEDASSPNQITPLDADGDTAHNFRLEFNVVAGLRESELGTDLSSKLQSAVRSADGSEIALSDPIPESEEIGGRMVGELRNAAIGAIVISMFLIVMYIRIRFHEYKYGIAAVAALAHDVLITLGIVVAANAAGIVNAELDLSMIAAFLTIIGYSINDTIVIFDRVRENLQIQERLGEHPKHRELLNFSINQTLSRTILTTATTFFVVLVQFVVNYGSGSSLEGFSFALIIGLISGTYSTVFIASPIVLWMRNREAARGVATTEQAAA